MRVEINQEEVVMRTNAKDNRYSFFTVVGFCFFLSVFVFTIPVYAAGEIVSWGDRKLPDQPLTNLSHVAAGDYHSLGLKTNGSIVAWGSNGYDECIVPLPNTGFTAIAANHASLAWFEK